MEKTSGYPDPVKIIEAASNVQNGVGLQTSNDESVEHMYQVALDQHGMFTPTEMSAMSREWANSGERNMYNWLLEKYGLGGLNDPLQGYIQYYNKEQGDPQPYGEYGDDKYDSWGRKLYVKDPAYWMWLQQQRGDADYYEWYKQRHPYYDDVEYGPPRDGRGSVRYGSYDDDMDRNYKPDRLDQLKRGRHHKVYHKRYFPYRR